MAAPGERLPASNVRLGTLLGAALLTAGCAADAAPRECADVFSFEGPGADEIVVLARSVGDAIPVAASRRPEFSSVPDEIAAYPFVVVETTPASVLDIRAGRRPSGPGSDRAFALSDTFLAVPWRHDAECGPLPWERDEWVSEGDSGVFRISQTRFHAGFPVIDVLGWYWPYPHGDSLASLADPRPAEDIADWLSPREFFSLLNRLPAPDPSRPRDEQSRAVEGNFRGAPTRWLETFPGPEIIRRARAWASEE